MDVAREALKKEPGEAGEPRICEKLLLAKSTRDGEEILAVKYLAQPISLLNQKQEVREHQRGNQGRSIGTQEGAGGSGRTADL